MIPQAYSLMTSRLLKRLSSVRDVRVLEYERPDWQFHAKGIWYTPPGHTDPSFTSIGSPNFGSRSLNRDLEAQTMILTSDVDLMARLKLESDRLTSQARVMSAEEFQKPERHVPRSARVAARIAKPWL